MSRVIDDELILTDAESINFLKSMLEPDWESIKERDNFINGFGENTILVNQDGTGTISIPSLDESILWQNLCLTVEKQTRSI